VTSGFYQDRISTGRERGTSDDRIALSRAMSCDGRRHGANPSKRDEGIYTCTNILPPKNACAVEGACKKYSRENGIDFTG
jgi:hypothetical protein